MVLRSDELARIGDRSHLHGLCSGVLAFKVEMIVVLTSPRKTDYLPNTLAALDAAGAMDVTEKLVLSDGPREKSCDWPIAILQKKGSKYALWQAIIGAAAAKSERLLFFEDDVLPSKNAVRRMLSHPIPKNAFLLSFFDLGEAFATVVDATTVMPNGLYEMDGSAFSSMCAVAIPRRSLRILARMEPPEFFYCTENQSDTALNVVMQMRKLTYALHHPSLVQHIGDVSAAGGDTAAVRTSPSFIGADFDVDSLPIYTAYAGRLVKS